MTIRNVTGDMEGNGKARKNSSYDKEACKIDLVEVFRVKEEVRNAKVFTKITRYHSD